MIAAFVNKDEIIVVELNADGSPMDGDGTLFGPDSNRDINTFMQFDADTKKGEVIHIEQRSCMVEVKDA